MARTRANTEQVFSSEKWKLVNNENKLLLEDFLTELRSNKKSEGTIKQYRADIRLVFCYLLTDMSNKYILELNKKDFRRINLWMLDRGVSNARANRLMSAIRSMLDFAEEDDDYDFDINYAKKVKGLSKEPVREIIFITDEQVYKLRERLREMKKYQWMCLLDLAYDSAGRKNELYQVEKHGLLDKNVTNVVVGKRAKKFKLMYFDRTKESLKLWLDQRGDDDIDCLWVKQIGNVNYEITNNCLYDWFVEMSKILSDVEGKEIEFSTHSFRHSSLDNLSQGTHYICSKLGKDKGFDISELKLLANHSDISTTMSYLKNRDDELLSAAFGVNIED